MEKRKIINRNTIDNSERWTSIIIKTLSLDHLEMDIGWHNGGMTATDKFEILLASAIV